MYIMTCAKMPRKKIENAMYTYGTEKIAAHKYRFMSAKVQRTGIRARIAEVNSF